VIATADQNQYMQLKTVHSAYSYLK